MAGLKPIVTNAGRPAVFTIEAINERGIRDGRISVDLGKSPDGQYAIAEIVDNGGVLFYAHPEERRAWDRPELTGMEIYNLHTDFKRVRGGLRTLLPELLVNLRDYPDHLYRSVFRRPTEFLQRWDELNRTRHITGIAANAQKTLEDDLRTMRGQNDRIRILGSASLRLPR